MSYTKNYIIIVFQDDCHAPSQGWFCIQYLQWLILENVFQFPLDQKEKQHFYSATLMMQQKDIRGER